MMEDIRDPFPVDFIKEGRPIDTSEEKPFFWIFCIVVAIMAFILVLFWPGASDKANAAEIDVITISKMESSGNPFARNGSHYGLCQIGRAVLADYNKKHGTPWEVVDLYNGVINLRIARWYLNEEIPRMLKYFKIKDTEANRITAWRLGILSVKKGKMAEKYFKKYVQLRRES